MTSPTRLALPLVGLCGLILLSGCGEEAVSHAAVAPGASPASGAEPGAAPVLPSMSIDLGDYSSVVTKKRLRVLVPYAQPYYFIDQGQPRGITMEIFREYGQFIEQEQGLRRGDMDVIYVPCELGSILPWLNAGYGDIAAGALTVTPERQSQVQFSHPVVTGVAEILVTSPALVGVSSLDDLAGRVVWVSAGSSYGEHLRGLSEELEAKGLEPIGVHEAPPTLATEDLLEMVHVGILEMTVCDDYKARLWAQVLPDLGVREDIVVHAGGELAWAVRSNNPQLLANLNEFVGVAKKGTLLGNILIKRYFNTTKWIQDPNDAQGRERIDRYAGWIKEFSAEYGFDWLRVAAQCYQESGLDPNAESYAGALGLMQLLPSTAKDMGCEDIHDPKENLRAGVRYLDWLRTNFFADQGLSEEDQMDFILAAYNAGPGNVRKWRKLAPARGLDPNRWRDNIELLALEGVGVQPIRYVNNIEKYYLAYSLALDLVDQRARYER